MSSLVISVNYLWNHLKLIKNSFLRMICSRLFTFLSIILSETKDPMEELLTGHNVNFSGAITKMVTLSHSKKSQSLTSHRILRTYYNTTIKWQLQVEKWPLQSIRLPTSIQVQSVCQRPPGLRPPHPSSNSHL